MWIFKGADLSDLRYALVLYRQPFDSVRILSATEQKWQNMTLRILSIFYCDSVSEEIFWLEVERQVGLIECEVFKVWVSFIIKVDTINLETEAEWNQ